MELYSKDKQYPTPLPHRITLSDGSTRTDASSFTEAEIADAGYILAPEQPVIQGWQSLGWNGTDWVINEKTIDQLKSEKYTQVGSVRDNQIFTEKTINLSTGQAVPVDVRPNKPDLQNLSALVQKATLKIIRNQTDTINFKGADNQLYALTPDEMVELGEGVTDQIEFIYQQSWIKKSEIDACVTHEEVYNLNPDWTNTQPLS